MDHVSKMVGYFSNGTGNFCSPTRTNMQTYISGFVASVPLHKGTEKTVLTVQKTSLLIFPSALLYPTTPKGFSHWICTTDYWIGAIDSLAQGQTPESITSVCPHTAALPSPQQLPGDVCGSDPAAASCRRLPWGSSKLLLISCCRDSDSSFSAWIENCF